MPVRFPETPRHPLRPAAVAATSSAPTKPTASERGREAAEGSPFARVLYGIGHQIT